MGVGRHLAGLALVAGLGLASLGALGGCADGCRPPPPPEPVARPETRARSSIELGQDDERLAGLPAREPRWHVSLPGPAPVLIADALGPVALPEHGLVAVASSAAGVVALDARTGALRWQRAGESAPSLLSARGDALWLAGRCAAPAASPAAVPAAGARALGCVEELGPGGALRARTWVRANAALRAQTPRHSRALGVREGRVLWAHGGDLVEVEVPGGALAAHYRLAAAGAQRAGNDDDDNDDDDDAPLTAAELRVHGWLATAAGVIAAVDHGLLGFSDCSSEQPCAPAWRVDWSRPVGVAGPVAAGDNLAWVYDDGLRIGRAGARGQQVPGVYSYAPGSVAARGGDELMTLRMSAEGVRPVRVRVRVREGAAGGEVVGEVVAEGTPVPGIQVLAAAFADGEAVAVIRLDRSLRRDVVAAWDGELNLRWVHALPVASRPRIEAAGVAIGAAIGTAEQPGAGDSIDAGARDAWVFYGGRFVLALPLRGD